MSKHKDRRLYEVSATPAAKRGEAPNGGLRRLRHRHEGTRDKPCDQCHPLVRSGRQSRR